ncbi:hypothetical protein FB2170_01721 [Maribacter sp. HTCC2170]|nr:hypothetical protein FB2170_01721 [Maribacter sp. HTCC2170]
MVVQEVVPIQEEQALTEVILPLEELLVLTKTELIVQVEVLGQPQDIIVHPGTVNITEAVPLEVAHIEVVLLELEALQDLLLQEVLPTEVQVVVLEVVLHIEVLEEALEVHNLIEVRRQGAVAIDQEAKVQVLEAAAATEVLEVAPEVQAVAQEALGALQDHQVAGLLRAEAVVEDNKSGLFKRDIQKK